MQKEHLSHLDMNSGRAKLSRPPLLADATSVCSVHRVSTLAFIVIVSLDEPAVRPSPTFRAVLPIL